MAALPTAPLLEVDGLKTHFFTRDGVVRAVDGVSFSVAARRDAGDRRRVGLRQERDLALDPAAHRLAAGPHRRRARSASRAATCSRSTEREMREVRGNEISMIFQEPMTSLNPVLTDRPPDRRGAGAAPRPRRARRRMARAVEMLRLVQHPRARAARRAVSAPAVRRHAPARDDRDGARLRPAAADRRRADHRARRHHPGADPRPDARAQGEDRRRDRADHARPRRGRGDGAARGRDVRRPQGRGGAGRRRCSRGRAIPTRAACSIRCRGSATRERARRASAWRRFPAWCRRCARRSPGCAFAPRCAYATERCRSEYPPLEAQGAGPSRRPAGKRIACAPAR